MLDVALEGLKKHNLSTEKNETIEYFVSFDLPQFAQSLQSLETSSLSSENIQSQLNHSVNKFLDRLKNLEQTIGHKLALQLLKKYFRGRIGFSAYQSELVKRAYEKPRGYPGDHELLEKIYNNVPVSREFGKYWDQYFLDDDLAEAVRDRKNKTVAYLKEYVVNSSKQKIRILNLACGSSRDLQELFEILNEEQRRKLSIICFDQDENALTYSAEKLSRYNVQVSYIKGNILNIAGDEYKEIFPGQDIVYSIGLTDYLPNRILQQFLSQCYNLLAVGGELFISHKDHTVYVPTVQDWFCDWTFFPRIESEIRQMIYYFYDKDKPLKCFRGDNNVIYYFIIVK